MPKLRELVYEFIDEKSNQGGSVRHARQGVNFGEILAEILAEQGLLEYDIEPTQEFMRALGEAVYALGAGQFGGDDRAYSFNNLRHRANWPIKMHAFVDMVTNIKFQAQPKDDSLFDSLFLNIKKGEIAPVLQAIEACPVWLQATSAKHRSNLILAALFELQQQGVHPGKRDNLLQFLHQVITQHGQHLNLAVRDAGGDTVLHRFFWYAIQVGDEETAHLLADLGCKMVGLIRNSASYSAIMGMRNCQGETFIDNIYFFPSHLTRAQTRNRDYLHASLVSIINPQQKSSDEPVASFKARIFTEQLEEILRDALRFDTMTAPMTLIDTGHTLSKETWNKLSVTTKRNPFTNEAFEMAQLAPNPVVAKVVELFNLHQDNEAELSSELDVYFNSFQNRSELEKAGLNALIVKNILDLTYSYFYQPEPASFSVPGSVSDPAGFPAQANVGVPARQFGCSSALPQASGSHASQALANLSPSRVNPPRVQAREESVSRKSKRKNVTFARQKPRSGSNHNERDEGGQKDFTAEHGTSNYSFLLDVLTATAVIGGLALGVVAVVTFLLVGSIPLAASLLAGSLFLGAVAAGTFFYRRNTQNTENQPGLSNAPESVHTG